MYVDKKDDDGRISDRLRYEMENFLRRVTASRIRDQIESFQVLFTCTNERNKLLNFLNIKRFDGSAAVCSSLSQSIVFCSQCDRKIRVTLVPQHVVFTLPLLSALCSLLSARCSPLSALCSLLSALCSHPSFLDTCSLLHSSSSWAAQSEPLRTST